MPVILDNKYVSPNVGADEKTTAEFIGKSQYLYQPNLGEVGRMTSGAPAPSQTLHLDRAPTDTGFQAAGATPGALGVKPDLARMVSESLPLPAQGLLGVAKGLLKLSGSGEKILRGITNPFLPERYETPMDAPTGAQNLFPELSESYTPAEKVGEFVAQSLPYFAVGGFAAPVGARVTAAVGSKMPALGQAAARLIGSMAGEVATSVPVTAALTRGDVSEIGWDTAISAGLPIIGRIGGAVFDGLKSLPAELGVNISIPKVLGLSAPQSFDALPAGTRAELQSGNFKPGDTIFVDTAGRVVSPATVPPPEITAATTRYMDIVNTLKSSRKEMIGDQVNALVQEANGLAKQIDDWASQAGKTGTPKVDAPAPERRMADLTDDMLNNKYAQHAARNENVADILSDTRFTPKQKDEKILNLFRDKRSGSFANQDFYEMTYADRYMDATGKMVDNPNAAAARNIPTMHMDVNNLGALNEAVGEDAGHTLIRLVGELLDPKKIHPDLYGTRTGGDEFAIHFDRVPRDQFRAVVEAVQKRIDEFNAGAEDFLGVPKGSAKGSPKQPLKNTISGAFGRTMTDAEAMVKQMKNEGRKAEVDLSNLTDDNIRSIMDSNEIRPTTRQLDAEGAPRSTDGEVERTGAKDPGALPSSESAGKADQASSVPDEGKGAGDRDLVPGSTRTDGSGSEIVRAIGNDIDINSGSPKPKIKGKSTPADAAVQSALRAVDGKADDIVDGLGTTIAKSDLDINKQAGLLELIRTPDRVMKMIGMATESANMRKAYDAFRKETRMQVNWLRDLFDGVSQESNQRIFQSLDGKKVDLTPDEKKIADQLKTFFKDMAERLNLPDENRVTDYITHIFERDFAQKEFDPVLAAIMDDRVAGSVYSPFVEERLGAQGYIEDALKATEAYMKRSIRKVYMDPVLEEVSSKADELLKSGKWSEGTYKWLKNYVDRVNMRPTDLEKAADTTMKKVVGYRLGGRPTTVLTRGARNIVYRAALGLNPATAIKNLSQAANTYAVLKEKYTAIGYYQLARAIQGNGLDELWEVGVLQSDFIEDAALTAGKKAMNTIDKGLYSLFNATEAINRGAAYFGAKAKALDEGKSLEEAIEYAKGVVRKTQFQFDNIDTPVALNSPIAKLFTQFQTFSVKQTEFLGEMIAEKDYAGIARYIAASLVFLNTVGEVLGMEPKDLIPSVRIIGNIPVALQIPAGIATAIASLPENYQNSPEDTVVERVFDAAKKSMGEKEFVRAMSLLTPGGVQMKRLWTSYSEWAQGEATDAADRKKYDVDQDFKTLIKTMLFGAESNPKAREYFEKRQGKDELAPIRAQDNPKDTAIMMKRALAGKTKEEKKAILEELKKGRILTPEVSAEYTRLFN